MKPKVSVIMPVHNGEKYIAEAIESVLAQTYTDYELIVIDDGSTDSTYLEIKPYLNKVKYIAHPTRRGVCAAANTGLRNASGELMAFIDGDDIWFPEKLQIQVDYLENNKDIGLVHSDIHTIDGHGMIIEESLDSHQYMEMPTGNIFKDLFMDSLIGSNTVVMRRECFDLAGGFDETLATGDYDLWLRIARHFKIGYVKRALSKYRQHDSQMSKDVRLMGACATATIEKMLRDYPEIVNELGKDTIKKRMAQIYSQMAYYCFNQGDFTNLRKYIVNAIKLRPANYRYYGYYLISHLNPAHAWAVRKMWQKFR